MAQKTEKEETEFKVKETLTLCINNCGVTGNPATNNMCQKCFTSASAATPSSSVETTSSTAAAIPEKAKESARSTTAGDPPSRKRMEAPDRELAVVDAKREVNRCSGCQRKIGLTGFRCRCGELFCWEHRYSDRHDCSYDYKAAGREVIARENPVVKAAKIVRV